VAWSWLNRHPRLVDAALFLAALAAALGHAVRHDLPAVGAPLAVVQCLPLLVRRRYPLAVLAVTAVATAAISGGWGWYNPLPAGIALFTVAHLCDRRTSLRAGIAALVVVAVPTWHEAGWSNLLGFAGRLVGFAVAWLIGDSLRSRREYINGLEERAERLEREQEAERARAVAEEQARIARELHDVIAHNVSVMVVQAAAANDVFETRPDHVREALHAIERSGRDALTELRRLLGRVRSEQPDYAPQPGLGHLDALVGQVRAAGLEVAVSVEGAPQELSAGIDLSAYRIVQEALTNTLRHADASRARVALRYAPGELDVEVRDDGTGNGNGGGAGRGLIGMRERVAAYGGSLDAGPAADGGFAVTATFPL
jgi:signal transduction histidine kinase